MILLFCISVLLQLVGVICDVECAVPCMICHDNPYICSKCAVGTYFRSIGAYYGCANCQAECVSCTYYNDCQECVKGRYGEGCQSHCSTGCFNQLCEQHTGNCTCKENFTGSTCDRCTRGRYGADCHLMCGTGCYNETCDARTGECVCIPGYTGLNCSECLQGRYGNRCQNECSIGCRHGTCDEQTGYCKCKANFTGERCDRCRDGNFDVLSNCSRECPSTCIACESEALCTECKAGHGGNNCTDNCMDHCTICSTSQLCLQCESGYWDSDCLKICTENCMNEVCDVINGTCTFGCNLGYHGEHCECNEENICTRIGDVYNHATVKNKNLLLFIMVIIISFVSNL